MTTYSPAQDSDSSNIVPPRKPKRKIPWHWIVVALVIATGLVAWDKHFKHQFVVERWAQVEPGLFRSSEMSRSMCEYMLQKHGIETIISLGADTPDDPDKLPEQEAAANLGIDRTAIAMQGDGTGTVDSYIQAVTLLANARNENKTVMVHCGSGVNRTGGVIACYEMLVLGESSDNALADMKSFDFSPEENTKLLPFLNQIMPALAMGLAKNGIIKQVPDPLPVLAENAD